ncbi:uncharacterized protein A4U43_C05F1370 [Asparagus officinalis]|uniref:Pectinesterase catalytic domain-containing protein n=1 Tax=Asparagus officinalis TaxID=4686 RepID=A0A5P1ENR3_ASPOF|nr:uncharacterized protein A4U43_C05F1370 [Asparagus officinalis]
MRNNKNKISIIAGSLVLSPPWSHASSSSSSTTTSPTTTSPPPLPPAAPPLRKSIQTDLPARRFRDSLPRKSSPKGSGQRHDTKSHQSRLEVPSEYLREELQPLRLLAEAAKDPRTPRLEDCQASFENAIKDYERRLDSFMGYPPRHGHVAWDINTVVTSAVSKLCTTARTAWPTTNKAAKRSKTPQQDAGDRPERDGDIARDREVHRGLQPVGHAVMADDFNVPKGHRRVRSKHADRRRCTRRSPYRDRSPTASVSSTATRPVVPGHASTPHQAAVLPRLPRSPATVDFICPATAFAIFQNCQMVVRLPMEKPCRTCFVTAHGSKEQISKTQLTSAQLHHHRRPAARPRTSRGTRRTSRRRRKPYAMTVYLQSDIDTVIHPTGGWSGPGSRPPPHTCFYAEIDNAGARLEQGQQQGEVAGGEGAGAGPGGGHGGEVL